MEVQFCEVGVLQSVFEVCHRFELEGGGSGVGGGLPEWMDANGMLTPTDPCAGGYVKICRFGVCESGVGSHDAEAMVFFVGRHLRYNSTEAVIIYSHAVFCLTMSLCYQEI